jgi:hypothetical protein
MADAGWYDDPRGEGLRWWDGSGWTEHVRAGDAQAAPATAQRYPFRYVLLDRWRVLLAGVLVIAAVAVGAVVVLGGGGSGSGGADEQAVRHTVDGFLSAVAKGKGCQAFVDPKGVSGAGGTCGFVGATGKQVAALDVDAVTVDGDTATASFAGIPTVVDLSRSGEKWIIDRISAQVKPVQRG